MMTRFQKELRTLLALEYNCAPNAFDQNENILTPSAILEGRRIYEPEKYFFHMCTLGKNAVITADEALHPFLRDFMKDRAGIWLFEQSNLRPLEQELNRHGYTLTASHHMFLPTGERVIPKKDYPVRWFSGKEFHGFYGDPRFPNAICESYLPHRPDRLVVCAYDGDEIMGMAGCSEDAPHWMQIGIDVLPPYRSMGVGSYLVTLLKNRIEEMGLHPKGQFY